MERITMNIDQLTPLKGQEDLNQMVLGEYTAAILKGGPLIPHLSPYAIFCDFTFLGNSREADHLRKEIFSHCTHRKAIPFIDFHEAHGWVLHTIVIENLVYKKEIAALFEKEPGSPGYGEVVIEMALAAQLKADGISVSRQVRCQTGFADIVTPDCIYEIKELLNRGNLFSAVGQVLLYRAAINPKARACVVGKFHSDVNKLGPWIEGLGVEVLVWK